jgi:hypothetical protein
MNFKYKFSFLVLFAGSIISGCNKPPELPEEPSIEGEWIQFKEAEGPDSLIISIYFKDGNGDLGLSSQNIDPPYHPYSVVYDDNGDTIKFGSKPGLPEYNPIDYIIIRDDEGAPLDTVLVEINSDHYNYFVHFYEKKNGQYTEFDWRAKPYYQTFDGRFPDLNLENRARPLEGSLRYGMVSSGWLFLFRDSLKISIQIQDRSLNKSNMIESPDFTLENAKNQLVRFP